MLEGQQNKQKKSRRNEFVEQKAEIDELENRKIVEWLIKPKMSSLKKWVCQGNIWRKEKGNTNSQNQTL